MKTPERVTQNLDANEQLLYFTSSSLTANDDAIYFISDRTGDFNVFRRDLDSGEEEQMTRNNDGFLKSYVYFDGIPYTGLGRASICLDPESGELYFIQGRDVCKATPGGGCQVLAQLPPDQMTAFTHVSADGSRLCVPTTDARALDGDKILAGTPDYDIDERVRTEDLSSYLHVYDTESGEQVYCEEVPGGWITHVQFSPIDRDMILYNYEWAADWGITRMWMFDGKQHYRMRSEGDGRSREDWACHEMWERDGGAVIYHGGLKNGRMIVGRVLPDGTGAVEITLPEDYWRYGHYTVGDPGVLVSDGYYEHPEIPTSDTEGGDWICRIDVDWEAGTTDWTPLCQNRSSWDSQDSHPHPIFDHAGKNVYFTSDFEGKRAVYRVNATI